MYQKVITMTDANQTWAYTGRKFVRTQTDLCKNLMQNSFRWLPNPLPYFPGSYILQRSRLGPHLVKYSNDFPAPPFTLNASSLTSPPYFVHLHTICFELEEDLEWLFLVGLHAWVIFLPWAKNCCWLCQRWGGSQSSVYGLTDLEYHSL